MEIQHTFYYFRKTRGIHFYPIFFAFHSLYTLKSRVMNGYIILRKQNACYPVAVEDVLRFEGCGSYTDVYLRNGDKHTAVCGYLSLYEDKVRASGLFLRVHKSHLIILKIVRF